MGVGDDSVRADLSSEEAKKITREVDIFSLVESYIPNVWEDWETEDLRIERSKRRRIIAIGPRSSGRILNAL